MKPQREREEHRWFENRILVGDALEQLKKLPAGLAATCITSPPYWGLRDYGVDGQIGLEPTLEAYVARIVAVFQEVRRVLRNDGTLWLNLGDGYFNRQNHNRNGAGSSLGGKVRGGGVFRTQKRTSETLKPKDLCGLPWRIALALQADGWYLRSDIIWSKPNPMPESVMDRPTKSHEYLFLLSKSHRYFYDAEAVKEQVAGTAHARGSGVNPKAALIGRHAAMGRPRQNADFSAAVSGLVERRNLRSVWHIQPQPYRHNHFAAFPERLVEPCIRAGTSEIGCCPVCGGPWRRIVDKAYAGVTDRSLSERYGRGYGASRLDHRGKAPSGMRVASHTRGWRPSCRCTSRRRMPCLVLDPFCGSGTSLVVAKRLGRQFLGIELNPRYVVLARRRIAAVPIPGGRIRQPRGESTSGAVAVGAHGSHHTSPAAPTRSGRPAD